MVIKSKSYLNSKSYRCYAVFSPIQRQKIAWKLIQVNLRFTFGL